MFISKAYAASAANQIELAGLAEAPTPMEGFLYQMGLLLVLVALFYVLLIMPQQRRFKEHSEMLSKLKKGDRVVTNGGLVGKIDKLVDEKEVIVDFGNGTKITALRSMLQGKAEMKPAANDTKATKDNKKATKDKKDNKKA